MNVISTDPILTASPLDKAQMKRAGASRDFEALLVGQMLRSVREEGSGWLGTGEDQASSAAFGLGEEALARTLSGGRGFGLARVIESSLRSREDPATANLTPKPPLALPDPR